MVGTDIQSMLGEMSAVCPSWMLQVQEDSGHVSPATEQLYGFGDTGQTSRASVYSWTRQTAPTTTGTNSQTGCVSKPFLVRVLVSGLRGAGGVRGPKANAGLPLWLPTLEQGKDRKMPDG